MADALQRLHVKNRIDPPPAPFKPPVTNTPTNEQSVHPVAWNPEKLDVCAVNAEKSTRMQLSIRMAYRPAVVNATSPLTDPPLHDVTANARPAQFSTVAFRNSHLVLDWNRMPMVFALPPTLYAAKFDPEHPAHDMMSMPTVAPAATTVSTTILTNVQD
jgi:hypothetical protein